jgi:Fur family ferric uptake transcriptional regulator
MQNVVSSAAAVRRLGELGHKPTTPRQIILDAALGRRGHFSGQEVYEEVRLAHPYIGRATVFRTIELLERAGMLESVHLPDGHHGYTVCGEGHHHHLICSRCGRTVEVEGCELDEAILRAGRESDFLIEAHRLEFLGLCGDCRAPASGVAG